MTGIARVCAMAALVLPLLLSCAPKEVPPPPPTEYWPTESWLRSTPEAQGIDANALADAIEKLRAASVPIHSLFVERNGFVVLDAYFFPFADGEPHDVASVTKSVISTLAGIAVGEHRLHGLDQPVVSYLPEAAAVASDAGKSHITLAHLLSMTSGLDCNAAPGGNVLEAMERSPNWAGFMLARPLVTEPGTAFAYCGAAMHLVSAALTQATGQSALVYAQQKLFEPLGIRRAAWPTDPQGASHGWGDLELQPRDMAKLGYLWLRGGRWGGLQIIPPDYLAAALSPHATVQAGIAYGYGMWLYPGHVPFDFEANGRGGQRITVVPSENLVEVMTSGGVDANRINPLVAAAVRSDTALPPNPEGDLRLARDVADAALPPASVMPGPLPEMARLLGGTTYALSANPLNLSTISFVFSSPAESTVRLGFTDGRIEDHTVGMDGVPRLSPDSASGLSVAMLGNWRNGGFDLSYDEIARINAFTLHIAPTAVGLSVRITERTGLVDATAQATAMP